MSLLLLINPKQFGGGSVYPDGPEIWINLLDGWKKRKKHIEEEIEEELEEVIEKVEQVIKRDDPRTDELSSEIAKLSALSRQLEELQKAAKEFADIQALQANLQQLDEAIRKSETERLVTQMEAHLQKEMEIDRKRIEIARKVLEMQDEEDIFWHLILNNT